MAKKPTAKKTAARRPAGKLSDVKPSKADSMLRIEQDAADLPADDLDDAVIEVAADGKASTRQPAAKATARKAPAKKAGKKPTVTKAPVDTRTTFMHGETRLTHTDEIGRLALEAMTTLIDDVHAMGRVLITSATHGGGTTMLHTVLPGHPTPYEANPGIILAVDGLDGLVSFDHVVIGLCSAAILDDAAHSLLNVIRGDAENPANAIGRRADWFDIATVAAEDVGARHVSA